MRRVIAALLTFTFACGAPIRGDKGETGDQGETGSRGELGPAGVTGAPGENGALGATGAAGLAGASGPTGADGLRIKAIFEYYVESFTGQQTIGNESLSYFGDIEVVVFEDGSAFVTTNGVVSTTNAVTGGGGGTVTLYVPIAHSFFAAPSTTEEAFVMKVLPNDGVRMRYKLNTSLAIPSFKATIDLDGNFTNNTDASYALTLRM